MKNNSINHVYHFEENDRMRLYDFDTGQQVLYVYDENGKGKKTKFQFVIIHTNRNKQIISVDGKLYRVSERAKHKIY